MSIKSLYRDYFQKSRIFLYPSLGIKRGVSIAPIQTFVCWKGVYNPKDRKLICTYHLRDDSEYHLFEKSKLLENPLFYDFKVLSDGNAVYVFDFSVHKQDWDCFLKGKYSRMTAEHKKRIKTFFGVSSPHYAYIESFLHPEKYYQMYAEIINVKEEILREVGELCDLPDMRQESLNISIKDLDMKSQFT